MSSLTSTPLALLLLCIPLTAQDVQFNRDIRPILSDKCYTCHGPSSVSRKTELRFDIESGSKQSNRPRPRRPERNVPPHQFGEHRRPHAARLHGPRQTHRQGNRHRSPLDRSGRKVAVTVVVYPSRNVRPHGKGIDDFILARLAREGLHPSPEADRRTLLRRLSLDLTGLPPTPAEVDAFLRDPSPTAYEKQVDRLLASPRYGERMAFRWLEAARFSDTNGYSNDGVREMWRWRDWVIDAFNRNLPYDEFTVDQIAGDLLPNPTLDQMIATGFNRNHRTSAEGGIVPEEFRVDYAADRTETTATVWMGLTVGCARCHDHKYDPIPQRDYYRMFAFFNSVPGNGFAYNFGNDDPKIKAPRPEEQKMLGSLGAKVFAAQKKWDALQPAGGKAERAADFKSATDWIITEGLASASRAMKPSQPKSRPQPVLQAPRATSTARATLKLPMR